MMIPGKLAGIAVALGILAAHPAAAQQAAKVPRVGFPHPAPTAVATTRIAAFLEGLTGADLAALAAPRPL